MTSRTCAGCGNGFNGRANAVYCSPGCKQRAYRERRDAVPIRNTKRNNTKRNDPVVTVSQPKKPDRTKASIRKELEKEFRGKFDQYRAECDANVAAYKTRLDEQNQKFNAMRDEERTRYKAYIAVARARGLITAAEYSLIRSCLHPDSRNSVTDEKLAAAFRLFNDSKIKTLLVKEK